MPAIAIVVAFTLRPGKREAFLELVLENAATSVRDEPGCSRFDVMTPPAGDEILLYEIYADAVGFDRHLASRHFKDFDLASRDLVLGKTIRQYEVVENVKS